MKIAVGFMCLAALVVLEGVKGISELQHSDVNEVVDGPKDSIIAQLSLERRRGKGLCRRKLGGRCVRRRKRCPGRLPSQTSPGRPYCGKFHRCCYKVQAQDCEKGWQEFDSSDKQYCFINKTMNWYNANAHCQGFGAGAQLAVLEMESLQEDVHEYMAINLFYDAWVGARAVNGAWLWENGNPVSDNGWFDIGYGIPPALDNRCAFGSNYYSPPMAMSSSFCTLESGHRIFICEK